MFEDDTDDDIRSLNALAMSPEAHQLVGDCPDCGTPKYHWEPAGPNWHCPKCGNNFPLGEEDAGIPWPKEVDEEEANWPEGRPEDDDLPGPNGGMEDSEDSEDAEEIPEKTTPDQADPDEALGEEGEPLKESQLWSPNHKPVSEGFFDKRMEEPITGPAATAFANSKSELEEPEGEDSEVTEYWRAHESTMGADGEWGIDGNIARALGRQKMHEGIEDIGDVGDFEKPKIQIYTAKYTIYPSRGEFRPKQKTFEFRARNTLDALTRVLYKLYYKFEGESYKDFLQGEDFTEMFEDGYNEKNVKEAIDWNSEETCLDSLCDEAGNLVHSSREEGVEDDEEIEEDMSMDEAVHAEMADSLKNLVDIFFSDLKGVYTDAIESGNTGAFRTLIQTMDREVLASAPNAYPESVIKFLGLLRESFMSELDLENQEKNSDLGISDLNDEDQDKMSNKNFETLGEAVSGIYDRLPKDPNYEFEGADYVKPLVTAKVDHITYALMVEPWREGTSNYYWVNIDMDILRADSDIKKVFDSIGEAKEYIVNYLDGKIISNKKNEAVIKDEPTFDPGQEDDDGECEYTLEDAKDILIDSLEDMEYPEALKMASEGLSDEDQASLEAFASTYGLRSTQDEPKTPSGPQETCKGCGWAGARGDLIWKHPFGPNRGIADAYCPQCNAYVTGYDSSD